MRVKGDVLLARKRLDAAKWWAGSNHEMAVIEYNRMVLSIHEGKIGEALWHLTTAFRLSPVNISWYRRPNIYVQGCSTLPGYTPLGQGEAEDSLGGPVRHGPICVHLRSNLLR